MPEALTPDWWLDRLYGKLRHRINSVREWDDWFTGNHPSPRGSEKAGPLIARILDTVGLNVLQTVTLAAQERMHVEGFKVGGKVNDDLWQIWQDNNFDLGSEQMLLERMSLSEAYVLVDPNEGRPLLTSEHPEQCITEDEPGRRRTRAAGLKVWFDDLGDQPLVKAMVYLPDNVYLYAAPTRAWSKHRGTAGLAIRPSWELQDSGSGNNPIGEVPLVPFPNRPRMLRRPLPEFHPAIKVQRRINKTLLDRMAMQDQGSFKALWATGIDIPEDPATGEPVEPFQRAIDRMFTNENPEGRFGQFEPEDIKQMLEAVRDDVKDAALLVPTPPDQILGEMVNVSADGLKSAQASLVSRVRGHMRVSDEGLEDVGRMSLKSAGKSTDGVERMTTIWRNPEYRTEGEMSDAATKALANGMPHEAVWERYYGATPDEVTEWKRLLVEREARDPLARLSDQVMGDGGGPAAGGS